MSFTGQTKSDLGSEVVNANEKITVPWCENRIQMIKDIVGTDTVYITGHKITDVDSYISMILMDKFLKQYGINSKPILLVEYENMDKSAKAIIELCECEIIESGSVGKDDYVFLVDHNNPNESIGNNGRVIGIVDHHQDEGFNSIFKFVKVAGSTTKIIHELFFAAGIHLSDLDKKRVLYSLSVDTCALLSTKADFSDKLFFDILSKELFLNKYRVKKETLFQTNFNDDFDSVLGQGYKEYIIGGYLVGTSYVECLDNHSGFDNIRSELFSYIEDKSKYDLYLFTVYDYLNNQTIMYTFGELSEKIPVRVYDCIASRGSTILPDIRKKIKNIVEGI